MKESIKLKLFRGNQNVNKFGKNNDNYYITVYNITVHTSE